MVPRLELGGDTAGPEGEGLFAGISSPRSHLPRSMHSLTQAPGLGPVLCLIVTSGVPICLAYPP